MFAVLYQNKYVGMAYDRFASLEPRQQKQVILGVIGFLGFIFFLFVGTAYWALWSSSHKAKQAYEMVNLLQEYEKQRRDKGSQIQSLDRNEQLAGAGQFKQHLMSLTRYAAISPRSIQVEEKPEGAEEEGGGKGSHDVKIKSATVTLERINLQQLRDYVKAVESGAYNLSISSIKITNDDKVRGYMKVELGVVAYLFQSEEEG